MTAAKLKNSGQAVIIDIGEGKDIHPKNKQDVAKRLARLALAQTYGVEGIAARSPQYKSMETQGNKIVLSFDHVVGGWRPFDVAEPRGFAIAGPTRSGSGPRPRSSATSLRSGPTASPNRSPFVTPGPTTPSATCSVRSDFPDSVPHGRLGRSHRQGGVTRA